MKKNIKKKERGTVPHALQRRLLSLSLRHTGVVLVPQFAHCRGCCSFELPFDELGEDVDVLPARALAATRAGEEEAAESLRGADFVFIFG